MYFKPILYCKFALGPYGSRIPKIQHAIVNFRVIETGTVFILFFIFHTSTYIYIFSKYTCESIEESRFYVIKFTVRDTSGHIFTVCVFK